MKPLNAALLLAALAGALFVVSGWAFATYRFGWLVAAFLLADLAGFLAWSITSEHESWARDVKEFIAIMWPKPKDPS